MTSFSFETAERIDSTDIIDDSVEVGFDDSDYYVFNLDQESTVDVIFDVYEDDADLYLYDSAQNVIASSTNGGFDSEYIFESLAAGDYYLEVYAEDSQWDRICHSKWGRCDQYEFRRSRSISYNRGCH